MLDESLSETIRHAIGPYNSVSQIESESSFSTGQHFASVANTNTKQLLVQNGYSDVELFILEPTVRAAGSCRVEKAFNPTIDVAGDAPVTGVVNKKSDGGANTSVTPQIGGDNETGGFSGGNRFSAKQLGGGTTPASVSPGEVGSAGVANIVAPGDSIMIELTNTSGNPIPASIDIDWFEIPTDRL